MKRNLYFIKILVLVILSGCKKDNNKVVINGQVEKVKETVVVLSSNNTGDTTFITKDHHFNFSTDINEAAYFNLIVNRSPIHLFLAPNDTLNISINTNGVKLAGNAKDVNNYLQNKANSNSQHLGSLVSLFNLSPKNFTLIIDSLFNEHNAKLEKLINKQISNAFFEMEKNSLTYEKAQIMIEYAHMSPNNYLISKPEYFDFLNDLTIDDSTLLNIPSYTYFLYAYVDWITSEELINKGELFPHEYTLIEMQQISLNFRIGIVKDKLLYNTLSNHIRIKGLKNSELLFKTFALQCQNKAFKEKLTKPYERYLAFIEGNKAPSFSLLDLDNTTKTLVDFKGKYIYIDVWATWCKPCIAEAPYFEDLKEKYKHKNIEFVSISVDKNKEKWLKYCQIKNKTHNQLWIENAQEFLDAYLIKTIPHFILIDEKGNILKVNANRPSDNKNEWLDDLPDKPVVCQCIPFYIPSFA